MNAEPEDGRSRTSATITGVGPQIRMIGIIACAEVEASSFDRCKEFVCVFGTYETVLPLNVEYLGPKKSVQSDSLTGHLQSELCCKRAETLDSDAALQDQKIPVGFQAINLLKE